MAEYIIIVFIIYLLLHLFICSVFGGDKEMIDNFWKYSFKVKEGREIHEVVILLLAPLIRILIFVINLKE